MQIAQDSSDHIYIRNFSVLNTKIQNLLDAIKWLDISFIISWSEFNDLDQKGSAAVLTTKRSAGVALEMNQEIPLHAAEEALKARTDITMRLIMHQNKGISGPTKRTYSSKLFKIV